MSLPPENLKYEEEEERFYAAMGRALDQWQKVETFLLCIFCRLMGHPNNNAANMAFHTILNFDTKLGMTHSVATVTLPIAAPHLWTQWIPLHNRASRRNDRRNELAHFAVIADPKAKPGYRFHLQPSPLNARATLRWGWNPPRRNVCQLKALAAAFSTLGDDMRTFWRALSGVPLRPPPEFHA